MATATTPTLELNNAITMPALGLGVFQSPPEETVTAVEAALLNRETHPFVVDNS
jgi:2,5-diketo-D-gluconate reductase A